MHIYVFDYSDVHTYVHMYTYPYIHIHIHIISIHNLHMYISCTCYVYIHILLECRLSVGLFSSLLICGSLPKDFIASLESQLCLGSTSLVHVYSNRCGKPMLFSGKSFMNGGFSTSVVCVCLCSFMGG